MAPMLPVVVNQCLANQASTEHMSLAEESQCRVNQASMAQVWHAVVNLCPANPASMDRMSRVVGNQQRVSLALMVAKLHVVEKYMNVKLAQMEVTLLVEVGGFTTKSWSNKSNKLLHTEKVLAALPLSGEQGVMFHKWRFT